MYRITFAFEYTLSIVLYTPPTVTLSVGFEFTATATVGFVLDTKGIREAIEEDKPLKALNSFGLKDTFDGVDVPMIQLTGTVTLEAAVSAAIVKVAVFGGVNFIITIDLFDPYPELSGGIIRPFELFQLGHTPDKWFEFGLTINVFFGVSISGASTEYGLLT